MPATNKRVSFGAILQAIEDKIVAAAVVPNSDAITWVIGDAPTVPQLTAEFDILLRARNAQNAKQGGYDGGSWDFRLARLVDIYGRSEAIAESGAQRKTWITEQFVKLDKVFNAVSNDDWWPVDNQGNLLTIEAVKLVSDAPPEQRGSRQSAWGDWIATLRVIYYPAITPIPLA